MRPVRVTRSTVSSAGTSRNGTWVVTSTTRSSGEASIIATSTSPASFASHSVCPG